MSLWVLILLLGLIKLPIVALMLWLPFRRDEEVLPATDAASSPEDDGGSKVPPCGPPPPSPFTPPCNARRRGPHGLPAPAAPARVRSPLTLAERRGTRHRTR